MRLPGLSRHHLERKAPELLGLVALALLLYLAAAAVMAWIAGFHDVYHHLVNPTWWWLPLSLGAVALSFVGYYFGYEGIGKVENGPVELSTDERLAVVAAGFGGFLAHGGSAIDRFVMRAGGASKREAKVRVSLLAGLEHGILAFPCSAAAIYLLVIGHRKPPLDFTIPWAVAPWIGFAIAFWAAERYRDQLRGRDGWRGSVSVLLDTVHLVREMFRHPLRYAPSLLGMLFFWLCDMFALWATVAAFGYRMNGGALMVAFGTAMIVTRRTGPLAGAGILMAALTPTLWYCGAPWPAAMLGVFVYRFFTLWLPLPFSFLAIPKLLELGHRSGELPSDETEAEENEPALTR
jgi:uncharacterized membrane protein YbhN (UPF0104 family)